ncbi:polyphosphate polymerase domain-containing protein [Ruminococcaceae bacterium OttesenSCG-928-A11]|nr:polyphosphate polymerase domain-containing protein [Ruminococcaceae bacterium OttesenSCG-928-A11]
MLRQKLPLVMHRDPNAGPSGRYSVHSIYFENPRDKVLMEKINGTDHRVKWRIRYYNDDPTFFQLEKKSKTGAVCHKEACNLAPDEVRRITGGDTAWMEADGRPLVRALSTQGQLYRLAPRNTVSYLREAFVYPHGNVRVTIDTDVRTSLNGVDPFTPGPRVPVNDPGFVILEVKFDEYLPDVIRGLTQVENRRSQSNSKYMQSRVFG